MRNCIAFLPQELCERQRAWALWGLVLRTRLPLTALFFFVRAACAIALSLSLLGHARGGVSTSGGGASELLEGLAICGHVRLRGLPRRASQCRQGVPKLSKAGASEAFQGVR